MLNNLVDRFCKRLNVSFLLILGLVLVLPGCFFGKEEPQEVVEEVKVSWSLETRQKYFDRRVAVKFHSGNMRHGILVGDFFREDQISLAQSPDEGVYNLLEISGIWTKQGERIYP